MTTIGVIGAGSWGVALAQLCASKEHRTVLWARRPDAASALAETRQSPYLPGITLQDRIEPASDPAALAPADFLLSVVPVQETRNVLARLAPNLKRAAPVVLCSKGVERQTFALPSAIAQAALPGHPVAVLSGPSFAIDVARGMPTAVTIAAKHRALAEFLQAILATQTFRPYPSDDLIGAQVGGAIKNVLAIACGIVVARRLGESAKAAIVARGFAEMARLATAMGAKLQTVQGLSGLGDLVLTCGSEKSRNFAFGLRLGDPGYNSEAKGVSEGKDTAAAAVALAKRYEVAMPICETTAAIIGGAIDVDEGVAALLARPLKPTE